MDETQRDGIVRGRHRRRCEWAAATILLTPFAAGAIASLYGLAAAVSQFDVLFDWHGRIMTALGFAAVAVGFFAAVQLPFTGLPRIGVVIAAVLFESYSTKACQRFAFDEIVPRLAGISSLRPVDNLP